MELTFENFHQCSDDMVTLVALVAGKILKSQLTAEFTP